MLITDGVATGKLCTDGLEQILPREHLDVLKRAGGEHGFATVLVPDPNLIAQLDAAKVRYGTVRESKWLAALVSWVAPALIFFGIWWFRPAPRTTCSAPPTWRATWSPCSTP